MILTCASCATRYYADENAIPAQGRTVRCASCGHSWRVERELLLENAAAAAPAPAAFVHDPPLTREHIERARRAAPQPAAPGTPTQQARARQMHRQKLERLRAAAIAWGATGGALAVMLALAVAFRQNVAQIWPNTASAYAAIGLSVNITGLEFSDLNIQRDLESAAPSLTVTGAVRNIAGKAKTPPVLRFSLRDHNAREVRSWLVRLDGGAIPPGEARPFQTVLANPPVSAVDIEATFATSGEAKHAPAVAASAPAPALKPAYDGPAEAEHAPAPAHAPDGHGVGREAAG
ncbi:MAG: MJ0042-type zinc finger domain-containing protein [Hyphomonadaceae bacterium]